MKTTNVKTTLLALMMLVLSTTVFAQLQTIDYSRPMGLDGVNKFETTKTDPLPFDGLRLRIGAGFTQQFQMLEHSNTATKQITNNYTFNSGTSTWSAGTPSTTVNPNELVKIGNSFNNATANLNIDVQLEKGVKVSLVTYLSARHHQEAWVKGGYIQFDQMPFFPWSFVEDFMSIATIKIGHMEINYGDQHFRRTDNGNASWNPFVGNTVLDAFTTEIGAELYLQKYGFLGMVAVTNGEISGSVNAPEKKSGSLILKGGYDTQLNEDLRVRLTTSYYRNEKGQNNTLYAGDRTGSRYYWVIENTAATGTANAFSGTLNPGYKTDVSAFQVNPFVKFMGFELFGIYEQTSGKATPLDVASKKLTQISGELLYRFDVFGKENVYVGARYNTVNGDVQQDGAIITKNPNSTTLADKKEDVRTKTIADATITRMQFAAGWYFTPNVLAKVEYVNQTYDGFGVEDIRSGAKFNGLMFEAVVGF